MANSTRSYYNEIDPFAAAWLRNLITAGLIADGDVDERDIRDVFPIDLTGYTQCHFFAGIGGWSCALRLANWSDDKPCWTGSCPCQPFSAAGQGAGFDDERHLWPAFFHLIEQCKPPVVFGEQVASKAGLTWLDLVQTDLEASSYATGALDLCAAGIGAPHIRQRLFWCANSMRPGRTEGRTRAGSGSIAGSSSTGGSTLSLHAQRREVNEHRENGCHWENTGRPEAYVEPGACGEVLCSSDAKHPQRRAESPEHADPHGRDGSRGGSFPGLGGDPRRQRLQEQLLLGRISIATMEPSEGEAFVRAGYTRGFWGRCDWWHGRDEKFRPIEPGVQPLATGVSKRVGKLRGYGNAIVPPLAAEFPKTYMDCCPED